MTTENDRIAGEAAIDAEFARAAERELVADALAGELAIGSIAPATSMGDRLMTIAGFAGDPIRLTESESRRWDRIRNSIIDTANEASDRALETESDWESGFGPRELAMRDAAMDAADQSIAAIERFEIANARRYRNRAQRIARNLEAIPARASEELTDLQLGEWNATAGDPAARNALIDRFNAEVAARQ